MVTTVVDALKKYWPDYKGDAGKVGMLHFRALTVQMALGGATEEEFKAVLDDFCARYA